MTVHDIHICEQSSYRAGVEIILCHTIWIRFQKFQTKELASSYIEPC